jgi:hypothetical protein
MKPVLRLGFADTFAGAKPFFMDVFLKRYEVIRDDIKPNYLIFGDRNFGTSNKNYNPQNTVKIFFTGENERPWEYQCHFAMSFDHIDNEQYFRFPHYVIYEYDHRLRDRWIRHPNDKSSFENKGSVRFFKRILTPKSVTGISMSYPDINR